MAGSAAINRVSALPAIGHTSSCLFGMVNWLLNEITAEQLGAGTTLEVYIAVPPALE
ncbi:hypothetical protein [Mesorhizobium sp. M1A.T.Ca.IN.004.03.1.1]|uniref:hypothetical protein n=1 Tax=Mesorhizobium sp. M1A.T.Ca.IN.004.03.1.1 TaxID=2496795 RepID=UPI0013E3EE49|nr:hypothetical protein [Mesorhizobium sp. M1A.T.Ca.IN.004.03.1.1]